MTQPRAQVAYTLCGLGGMRFSLGDKAGAAALLEQGLAMYALVDPEAAEAAHFQALQQQWKSAEAGEVEPKKCG